MTALARAFAALGLFALFIGANALQLSSKPHPNFVPLHPASPESTVTLTFALPPNNSDGLHAALMDVSDPASPKYGKHLSKSEVSERLITFFATITTWRRR